MSSAIAAAPSKRRSRCCSRKAGCPSLHPQPLPDPVAQDESRVEDADDGLFARHQLPVDGDQDLPVAGIVDVIVGPVRGRHPTIIAGEAPG